MIALSEPVVFQQVQMNNVFPSPHTRVREDYFSVSTVSGGPSIMAASASSQSFSGCSRNSCTSI